jgi:hypothetical protein
MDKLLKFVLKQMVVEVQTFRLCIWQDATTITSNLCGCSTFLRSRTSNWNHRNRTTCANATSVSPCWKYSRDSLEIGLTYRPNLRRVDAQSYAPWLCPMGCSCLGFGLSRFFRWYDHKYGQERQSHDWIKVHLMCGVKTNIVTAVEIHGRHAADAKLLAPLLKKTKRNFKLGEVSADKGYLSYDNAKAIMNAGATPFIAFKNNSTVGFSAGHGHGNWSRAWAEMYHYFMFKRDEFLRHYHKRSNVESTFSMMKRKFGDSIRSKTQTAAVNEVLCKVLCHNIVVLIHESLELGLEPIFWAKSDPAQQKPEIGTC